MRVLRWRCYTEEYSPTIRYVEGPLNIIAAFFSRMPRGENPAEKSVSLPCKGKIKYENFFSVMEDAELLECFLTLHEEHCFLNLPNTTATDSPVDIQTISEGQAKDENLISLAKRYPQYYFNKDIDEHTVICYCKHKEQKARCG